MIRNKSALTFYFTYSWINFEENFSAFSYVYTSNGVIPVLIIKIIPTSIRNICFIKKLLN